MLKSRNSVRIKKKNSANSHHRCICVICKREKQLFRGASCTGKFFLSSWKISWELPITKNDYSNVARATLLKSLLAVDIFLRISQEFRNILRKEHLRKAAPAAFFQMKIKVFDLKYRHSHFLRRVSKGTPIFRAHFSVPILVLGSIFFLLFLLNQQTFSFK